MAAVIVLPGPIVLADPLPDGWRRPDPAPWRDPAEVAVTVERLAPVAGPEVDVGAEVRPYDPMAVPGAVDPYPDAPTLYDWCQRLAADRPDCARFVTPPPRFVGAPILPDPDPEPAPATRAERIEAAARALVVATRAPGPTYAWAAVWEEIAAARASLVAALCSCTGHGPDLACVDHGEALRAWQKRHAP